MWRRLELASDLFLNDVHDIIQVAVGWTDSHLHQFGSGPAYYSHETEYYLCPFEIEEAPDGIPEEHVRLDEVLAEPGDTLFYCYDFGDDWLHIIELEAVRPRDESRQGARCIGGERPGPAEDCGGVPGYEMFAAANDATNPDRDRAAAELRDMYGFDIDPTTHEPVPFDADEVNRILAELSSADMPAVGDLPAPLLEIHNSIGSTPGRRRLRRLIGDARLGDPVMIDVETATAMVSPYTWLLDRVGDDGIKLTNAGYLPPAHVEAAMAELNMEDEWIGKFNREDQTLPVLLLRETAQKLGLVRKYRGKLLPTSRARRLRDDPVALWWHLAASMPLRTRDPFDAQASLLYLTAVAADAANDGTGRSRGGVDSDDRDKDHHNGGDSGRHREALVARLLTDAGWRVSGGAPLGSNAVIQGILDTEYVLRRLGAFDKLDWFTYVGANVTPRGITFARAALRSTEK